MILLMFLGPWLRRVYLPALWRQPCSAAVAACGGRRTWRWVIFTATRTGRCSARASPSAADLDPIHFAGHCQISIEPKLMAWPARPRVRLKAIIYIKPLPSLERAWLLVWRLSFSLQVRNTIYNTTTNQLTWRSCDVVPSQSVRVLFCEIINKSANTCDPTIEECSSRSSMMWCLGLVWSACAYRVPCLPKLVLF